MVTGTPATCAPAMTTLGVPLAVWPLLAMRTLTSSPWSTTRPPPSEALATREFPLTTRPLAGSTVVDASDVPPSISSGLDVATVGDGWPASHIGLKFAVRQLCNAVFSACSDVMYAGDGHGWGLVVLALVGADAEPPC